MIAKFATFIANKNYTLFATITFFTVIFILFTFPVLDSDFFWHVKTGQWIWEHKSLLSVDPFSHINWFIDQTDIHVADRTTFILKQYWLGQLALFGIWKVAGDGGVVILRSIIYTGILIFMYWWLKGGKKSIIPLATVFLVGNVLRTYPNERPQLFAYLFMVFLLYLLESLINHNKAKKHSATGLMMLMFVWSNCHGSYILGLVVITLYMISQMVSDRLCNIQFDKKRVAVMSTAMLCAFINPNGFSAFKFMVDANEGYHVSVTEYLSPIIMVYNGQPINYTYFFLLVVAVVLIIFNFRSMALRHSVVLLSLAALSLLAIRYIPFFVLAAPLISIYLPAWKPQGKYNLLLLMVMLIWLWSTDFKNVLKFRAGKVFPVQAVEFLNNVKPLGKLFNFAPWGGYLICYTGYPVFADGRTLDKRFTGLHNEIMSGADRKGILTFFQINTIVIPGVNELSCKPYPVLLQLFCNTDWSLIYQDDVALIFLRNIPQNKEILARYTINKDRMATHIYKRLGWLLKNEL